MQFFNINFHNLFKRSRTLPTQQTAEVTRNVARNLVNRGNDNPQQEEDLAPVRYEHIVGHLIANSNTRPQQAQQPVENNNVQQPQPAPAAQPVAEELHEEQPTNGSTSLSDTDEELHEGQPTNGSTSISDTDEELHKEQPANQPAIQPIAEKTVPVDQPFAYNSISAVQPVTQPFAYDSIPVVQPVAQPFAYDSISAVQPVATGQVPVVVQPLYSRLMEPQIRRSNADADITLYGHGKHQRTGSIDVKPGALANVTYANNGRSFIDMPNGGRIHRSNSITVEPGTKAEMTSSDGHTKTSIEFENGTRISHDGSFDF
ncbi:MAG: hypothetical protein MRZ90_08410 [Candidatus Gastranaerophilales bacterium]|nr:hypothetical protein [Candidatus Gastranaerophilales bacterium]